MSRECGRDVVFQEPTIDAFESAHPAIVAKDVGQTMLLVGNYSYYGPGQDKQQAQHEKWLLNGAKPLGLRGALQASQPWKFD
jgi:hypothetical protein